MCHTNNFNHTKMIDRSGNALLQRGGNKRTCWTSQGWLTPPLSPHRAFVSLGRWEGAMAEKGWGLAPSLPPAGLELRSGGWGTLGIQKVCEKSINQLQCIIAVYDEPPSHPPTPDMSEGPRETPASWAAHTDSPSWRQGRQRVHAGNGTVSMVTTKTTSGGLVNGRHGSNTGVSKKYLNLEHLSIMKS